MLLLLTAAFLLKRYGTQAVPLPAPIPKSSTLEVPIFARNDPSTGCHSRAVLDILWSCLATTLACTWVSVHPNVPFREEGWWVLLMRRIFLMFFSILAPEFMIMWAFKQWRGAVLIKETINKVFPELHNPWTTAHGHFLQMGGFRISMTARENFYLRGDTKFGLRKNEFIEYIGLGKLHDVAALGHPLTEAESRIAALGAETEQRFAALGIHPDHDKQLTELTPEKMRLLIPISRRSQNLLFKEVYYRHQCRPGTWTDMISEGDAPYMDSDEHIWEGVLSFTSLKTLIEEDLVILPAINAGEINDRSKSDAFSKGIALLQLAWFITQIIARQVQGLAITELELTTAALVGLNSIMYLFWWSKPQGMRFPVVIRTKGAEALRMKNKPEPVTRSFKDLEEFCLRSYVRNSLGQNVGAHQYSSLGSFFKKSFLHPICSVANRFWELLYCIYLPIRHPASTPLLRYMEYVVQLDQTTFYGKMIRGVILGLILMATLIALALFLIFFFTFFTLILGVFLMAFLIALPISSISFFVSFALILPIFQISRCRDWNGSSDKVSGTRKACLTLSMIFFSEDVEVKPLFSTSAIAGALFGAVHCFAWHFNFASYVERLMWRTASLGVVGACTLSFTGSLASNYIEDGDRSKRYYGFIFVFWSILALLTELIYATARLLLFVLAVTSLRSLPPSAFDTIHWVELVPHI